MCAVYIVSSTARPTRKNILYGNNNFDTLAQRFFLFHNNNNTRSRTSRMRCSDFNAATADERNVLQLVLIGTIYYYHR